MGIFSWTTEAGETGGPVAPGYCFMALSSNATLNGLSAESLPDPGTSVPSTMAQNGCEMPPKPWSNWRPGRGHADRRQAPPSAPVKTESGATAAAGLQHSLNSAEAAVRNEASCSGEDGRASLQTVRCLQGRFSWAQILASSHTLRSTKVSNCDNGFGLCDFFALIIPHQRLNSI